MAKNLISGKTTTINENGDDIAVELNSTYKDIVDSVGYASDLETIDKASLVNAINELYDSMYYKPGDIITGTFQIAGYVTSGTKDLYFMIYLPKSVANISSITVSGGSFNVRSTNGAYVNGGAFNYNASGLTTTASNANSVDKAITILVRSTNTYTNVSNNTPVAGAVSGLTLEFN